jgi:hypothetical protein
VIAAIRTLMEYETAGDPMTDLKWTRKTTQKVAEELTSAGIPVSANTVGRLLKALGFSLRVNRKKLSGKQHPARDQQFQYIHTVREEFARRGAPMLSHDTKKRELVGAFRNPGQAWSEEPVAVNDHDFRSDAKGIAIPYGILDLQAKEGAVFVGTSRNTAAFAVDSLVEWWEWLGGPRYPGHRTLLLLCDGGGSNSSRCRAWKVEIQEKLCDGLGLTVTVCHYPPGTSKWNPVEHTLFSPISRNWAGRPLDSYETMLNYLHTTRTRTGLRVHARLNSTVYPKGVKIPAKMMAQLNLRRHDTLPAWNYTLSPRS